MLEVDASNGRIADIKVLKGAPCGATWQAASRILNLPVDDALLRIGLDVQYFCTADPAGWDPVYGKSPVHLAGKIHQKGLAAALQRFLKPEVGMRKSGKKQKMGS